MLYNIESMTTRKLTVLAIALFTAMLISSCHKESDEDRIRKILTDVQTAAEEKDVSKITDSVSKSYRDSQGMNHDTLKKFLAGYFLVYPKISVYINNLQIGVEETTASATFHAIFTSGRKTGSVADIIPQSFGVYQFDLSMNKESNEWKVVSASWAPVEMSGSEER